MRDSSDTHREKRSAPREAVHEAAMLQFGDRSVRCDVRNISTSGVVVTLLEGRDVPEEVLFQRGDETAWHPAVVVRRHADNVALRFISA
jgi:hypothetical protein